MKASAKSPKPGNVYDIFTGRHMSGIHPRQVVRIAPENDGFEILYSNPTQPDKLFTMKIVCWALRRDGQVVAMIPWVNRVIACADLDDPRKAHFEGYYDPKREVVFTEPPPYKVHELQEAAAFFGPPDSDHPKQLLQELPDVTGTHAMLSNAALTRLTLAEILSWRLLNDGSIHAMLVNEKKVRATPVLVGDECLYTADSSRRFRYFFQHHIANQIKDEDPEALAAIALLLQN